MDPRSWFRGSRGGVDRCARPGLASARAGGRRRSSHGAAVQSTVGSAHPMVEDAERPLAGWTQRLPYACALAAGALMSVFLLDIPVQLSDSFTELTAVADRSLGDVVAAGVYKGSHFPPLCRGPDKILFDLAGGPYYVP